MRFLIFVLLFIMINIMILGQPARLSEVLTRTSEFLEENVQSGKVNYKRIISDRNKIDSLKVLYEAINLTELSDKQRKAFWINAYNLLVIYGIVNNYPVDSPMQVPGFFDKIKYNAAGESLTLNEIENNKLRRQFDYDPRLHFVLVCAAVSCPPIIDRSYVPENLEEQLGRQTQRALNNDQFIRVKHSQQKVLVSEIFKWYREDFLRYAENIRDYINQYRVNLIPDQYELGYYTYDWTLNNVNGLKAEEVRNLQEITPGALLPPGTMEYKLFNNLYVQKHLFNESGTGTVPIDGWDQQAWFTMLNQFLYGYNQRFNVGFEVWLKWVRYMSQDVAAYEVFGDSKESPGRWGMTAVGPKIKVLPFKNLRHFTIETGYYFPLTSDLEGEEYTESPGLFLENDRQLWLTKFFYDRAVGTHFQVFLQLSAWYGVVRSSYRKNNTLETPLIAFLSYLPTSRWTFYLMSEYWPAHYNAAEQEFQLASNYYFQSGAGSKYQIVKGRLELEALYTKFWAGSKDQGAGQTFNIGFRFIY